MLIPTWAWGATYYLSDDGTAANKGAASGPCGTASAACMNEAVHNGETFSAGDFIYLCDDDGDITTPLVIPSSGDSSNDITYMEASGETVTIDCSGGADGACIETGDEDYITIDGLTITGGTNSAGDDILNSTGGIWVEDGSDYITITNNTISSCQCMGVG